MSTQSAQFIGNIPEHYDRGLGPNIFADFAANIALRAGATGARDVLELAAGTGIVSRLLRDALSSTVNLTVTDLNPPMLEVARRKFSEKERVSFAPADAMSLDYPDASFDLLVCQFGVMFFPDKPASFREARRVLKPGGRYIFNSWGAMSANPFAEITQQLVERVFPRDPPGFYRVPFSYPDPAKVKEDLYQAGLTKVAHETVTITKRVTDLAGFAQGIVFGNPLIGEIEQRGGIDPKAVKAAVMAALSERFGPEPFVMPLVANFFSVQRD